MRVGRVKSVFLGMKEGRSWFELQSKIEEVLFFEESLVEIESVRGEAVDLQGVGENEQLVLRQRVHVKVSALAEEVGRHQVLVALQSLDDSLDFERPLGVHFEGFEEVPQVLFGGVDKEKVQVVFLHGFGGPDEQVEHKDIRGWEFPQLFFGEAGEQRLVREHRHPVHFFPPRIPQGDRNLLVLPEDILTCRRVQLSGDEARLSGHGEVLLTYSADKTGVFWGRK